MKNLNEYMLDYGYTKENIDKMLNSYPLVKSLYSTIYSNMIGINDYLSSNRINKKKIINMGVSFPTIYCYNKYNLENKISELIKFGYTKQQAIKLIVDCPQIVGYTIDNISRKFNYFNNLGIENNKIIKVTVTLPHILGYSIDKINSRTDYFLGLGYSINEIIKMIIMHPRILSLDTKTIEMLFNKLLKLGFLKKDILNMTINFPNIYGLSIINIENKLKNIINLDYTKDEAITMIKNFPQLLGLNILNISEKISFYKELGIHKIFVEKTRCLMQSIYLSYARYCFYKENNVIIDRNNINKLFIREKQFYNTYKLTNKELLEKYSYNKYLKELEDGKRKRS